MAWHTNQNSSRLRILIVWLLDESEYLPSGRPYASSLLDLRFDAFQPLARVYECREDKIEPGFIVTPMPALEEHQTSH
jgi:hypothetical protein